MQRTREEPQQRSFLERNLTLGNHTNGQQERQQSKRTVVFQAQTLIGVAATATFTDAATVAITAAPTASTNAAITRAYAFWVQAGNSRFDGNITSRGGARTWGTEDSQTLALQTNGTARHTMGTTGAHTFAASALNGTTFVTFTQSASTSGSSAGLLWTGAAHTAQTASTELTDINWNLARTVTLAAGTVATQRAFRIQAPTYAGSAATATFTTAATLAISNAPQQGINASITTALALWVENGNSRFSGNEIQFNHLRGLTTAPVPAAGVGAGTTPTITLTGTDTAGTVSVTTGTTPTGSNSIVVTVTFNRVYTSAPFVVLTPANRNALALGIGTQVTVPANGETNGVTTTTFVIESGATALAASTQYIWAYHVIQ